MSFSRPLIAKPNPRALGLWLLLVASIVFLIIVVGGITRLTESGLSIVEWKPIRGIIPPLNPAQWQAEFDAYKQIPQYQQYNLGMTLAGFKEIYFWEYLHRLLARTFGLALALVLAAFWWRRAIPEGFGRRMILVLLLGALQGVIGWWMVASGLVQRTEVSHIRLAIHLLAALLIFSVLIWTALDLFALARDPAARPSRITRLGWTALALLGIQMLLGAFVAGLRAGYAFSSWPKMGDEWFPHGGWHQDWGAVRNLIDNPIVVQFAHRWWAWVAAIAILLVARQLKAARLTGPTHAIVTMLILQIVLGIATLMTGVAIHIAAAHQAVAALLLASLVWGIHKLGSVRG